MMNFVYTRSSTPGQIQYGGFKRALAKKSGDVIRVRDLLFLWVWAIGLGYYSGHAQERRCERC